MGSIVVNKEKIEQARNIVEQKRILWEKAIPNVKFDKDGRGLLCDVPIDYKAMYSEFHYSKFYRFSKYIEKVMVENKYVKMELGSGSSKRFRDYADTSIFDLECYAKNIFRFEKENGKIVSVKATRILSKAHDFWLEDNPLYSFAMSNLKSLREQGFTYESPDIVYLTNLKNELEYSNLFINYQQKLNAISGNSANLWLTINPLDLLCSAGGTTTENPTTFNSCWSTRFSCPTGTEILVEKSGDYSCPETLFNLGSMINRGMVYIPNDRITKVEDFLFLGYRERGHVWIDSNIKRRLKLEDLKDIDFSEDKFSITLEKMYPSKDVYRKNAILESINKVIPVFFFEKGRDIKEFKLFDFNIEKINNDRVYLDRVGIYDNILFYLGKDRLNYSWRNQTSLPDNSPCKCACCGEYRDADYMYSVYEGTEQFNNRHFVCEDCLAKHYSKCNSCGDNVKSENIVEHEGRKICKCCLERKLKNFTDTPTVQKSSFRKDEDVWLNYLVNAFAPIESTRGDRSPVFSNIPTDTLQPIEFNEGGETDEITFI